MSSILFGTAGLIYSIVSGTPSNATNQWYAATTPYVVSSSDKYIGWEVDRTNTGTDWNKAINYFNAGNGQQYNVNYIYPNGYGQFPTGYDLTEWGPQSNSSQLDGWYLTDAQTNVLAENSGGLVYVGENLNENNTGGFVSTSFSAPSGYPVGVPVEVDQ